MAFDKAKYLEGFKAEVKELLQDLSLGLLKLEKKPTNKKLLESLMRKAHTIKGSATMMGYKRIADISHNMEDGLDRALQGELSLKKNHFDILLKCLDAIDPLLEDKVTWQDKGIDASFVENICAEAKSAFCEDEISEESKKKESKEELAKKEEIAEEDWKEAKTEDSIRINVSQLNKLVNLSGEMLVSKIRLKELVSGLQQKVSEVPDIGESFIEISKGLTSLGDTMDFLTSNMQEEVMKSRMIPISYLFNTFPRAMRDLARQKGKNIQLEINGQNTYLDKTIVDQVKDPIMHLLRNAVDHGVETIEKRQEKGKPEESKIALSAYQEGSLVVIEVSDDGNGIDVEKVKQHAVSKGLVSESRINDMIDDQVYQLLFSPGFSTAEEVTETSGRGVGLDVVRENIVQLKGMIEVQSDPGKGTRFIIKLPLTLAITESLLVAAGSDMFAIPIESVVETIRIKTDEIKTIEARDVVVVRGHILPLVRISDIFGISRKGIFEKNFSPVVIVQSVEKRIAILIDDLIGRQEIITKAIGDPLKNVRDIAGATILGNGKVILILDVPSIIDSAEGVIVKRPIAVLKPAIQGKKKKTILLAEDVLSTAMLEKNILESSGFSVVIARDGKEALDRAAQETFDLVISDVLMPRMDGFELATNLRKSKTHKGVPIIMVTTREKDEDKRRGLEAGANAYILKKDFTSEILLETIERLVG